MLALLLLCDLMTSATPLYASHEGTVTGDAVEWRSRIVVDEPGLLRLRRPLPSSAELDVATDGAAVMRDADGDATAIAWRQTGRTILRVSVRQPLVEGREDVALHAPLVDGALERVALYGDGVRFRPDTALGLEQRIGLYAGADVGWRERRALERLLEAPEGKRPATPPVWLSATTPAALRERGLAGTLARGGAGGTVPVVGATLALAAALVVALLAGVRVLQRKAASERAERILEAEWREVDKRIGA